MKILIIGGTGYLGRYMVEAALQRQHTVTLFNRGQSNAGLFPQVETIIGDRETDLPKLAGRWWDAVIDTCGYVPRVVRLSAEALRAAAGCYVFISSTAVYAEFAQVGMDETAPGATLEDETNEDVDGHYGALKVLCEKVALAVFPGRTLIIRPHFVVGPLDERFTYWAVRVARGGDVLAPIGPDEPCMFIDVRDLGEWTMHAIETKTVGTYNAAGPEDGYTFGQLLETCKQVSGSDARFLWASAAFLAQQGVEAHSDFPIWLPPDMGPGPARLSFAKARAAGLGLRPVAETVRASLEWVKTLTANYQWQVGLPAEKEAKAVAAFKQMEPGA